jgi:hypothetical protein
MKSDLDNAKKGTCEQCGQKHYLRPIENLLDDLDENFQVVQESTYSDICFACLPPMRILKKTDDFITMVPLDWSYEECVKFIEQGRRPVPWHKLGKRRHIDDGKGELELR